MPRPDCWSRTAFANLGGVDLAALAPHVTYGLARAICERAAAGTTAAGPAAQSR